MTIGIGRQFLEATRLDRLDESDQERGAAPPPPVRVIGPAGRQIRLPEPGLLSVAAVDFARLVGDRTSVREYGDAPFTQAELSLLLWCTQGVKRVDGPVTSRTVPSAGSRHALETLLLVHRVEELPPGLYAYDALEHSVRLVESRADITARITAACLGQPLVRGSAVTFIWVAIPDRMCWRYGERGYRYLLLDAGHVCQNLYLAAEAIGAGACAIAAFDDEALDGVLGLDGKEEFVIYAASAGRKRGRRDRDSGEVARVEAGRPSMNRAAAREDRS